VLGDVRLRDANGKDRTPKSRKGRAMLALLALAPDMAVSRERFANMLWPDALDEQARTSLRQTLAQLRPAFDVANEPLMHVSRDRIALAAAQILCDATSLLSHLRSGQTEAALDILKTWQGDYLAELASINDVMADWARMERASFDAQLRSSAESEIARLVENGAHELVRSLTSQLLAHEASNEVLVRAAMQADAALGDLPSLHKRFQTLRLILEQEFESHPAPATRELFTELMQPAEQPTPVPEVPIKAAAATPVPRSGFGLPLIVVPPFKSSGLSAEALGMLEAMQDDILTGLIRYREMRTLAAETMPAAQDAAWLGGDAQTFVLHVAAREAGGSYRVTARVTRLHDGHMLWSETFTLASLASWDTMDTITHRVLGAVLPALEHFHQEQLPHTPKPTTAYEFYLRGRSILRNAYTPEQGQQALELLEHAIAIDPELSLAYPQLSHIYNTGIIFNQPIALLKQSRNRAFHYAQKALQLDPRNSRYHVGMGWCHLWREEWDLASESFETAYETNPFNAETLFYIAFGNIQLGDFDYASLLLKQRLILNPFPDDDFFVDLAWLETLQGQYDVASQHFSLVESHNILFHTYAAVSYTLGEKSTLARHHALAIVDHTRRTRCTDGIITADAIMLWIRHYIPMRDQTMLLTILTALHSALSDVL
jgi:DNA-binding SARP family transcriptional activator/TolB-like protein